MKPAGYVLLVLVAAEISAAEPTTPARTSPRLAREIRAGLPRFVPAGPATVSGSVETPLPPDDPDVFKLPRFVIQEKRLPTNDPDVWLTERAVQHKAMAAYQDSLTPLEWVLNSWYIPLFGSPPSVRARQYYEARKLADEIDRLNAIIKVVRFTDPKGAAKIRDAMDLGKLPKED